MTSLIILTYSFVMIFVFCLPIVQARCSGHTPQLSGLYIQQSTLVVLALKTHFELEPVTRCEPITYHPYDHYVTEVCHTH